MTLTEMYKDLLDRGAVSAVSDDPYRHLYYPKVPYVETDSTTPPDFDFFKKPQNKEEKDAGLQRSSKGDNGSERR